jgi:hypothetical protein
MRALQANADAELLFDDYTDGDVVIMNNDIYRGTDDIIIRLVNEQGELYAPHICFSKDKAGNSYYYNGFYGFGLKLDGSVYDDILKLMKPLSEPRVSSPILVG